MIHDSFNRKNSSVSGGGIHTSHTTNDKSNIFIRFFLRFNENLNGSKTRVAHIRSIDPFTSMYLALKEKAEAAIK
jgi:hypothetical protein